MAARKCLVLSLWFIGGLVHWVPCAVVLCAWVRSFRVPCSKSREKLQEKFVSECFVNGNTVTHFNLFLCPFKQRDMSVMTRVPNFIL